jgi:membrane dipeptidase
VDEAVRLGIVIDQSHASDAVFDDLIERMPVPFVLSHSSAKAIYNHPRNLDDARLARLAKAGGVIQVNAYGGYLIDIGKNEPRALAEKTAIDQWGGYDALSMAQGVKLAQVQAELDRLHPVRKATLDDFFAHFEHILKVVGPEHVGIGLDWDGGGGLADLQDVSELPKITAWLLRKGYSTQQIAAIWGGNLLRVMQQAQDHANKLAATP